MTPPLSAKALAIYRKVFWFCQNCATTNNMNNTLCRTCKTPSQEKDDIR